MIEELSPTARARAAASQACKASLVSLGFQGETSPRTCRYKSAKNRHAVGFFDTSRAALTVYPEPSDQHAKNIKDYRCMSTYESVARMDAVEACQKKMEPHFWRKWSKCEQHESGANKRQGRQKHTRWLRQKLLMAALRRRVIESGQDPSDGECNECDDIRAPSLWEMLQLDHEARNLYIKRKDETFNERHSTPTSGEEAAHTHRRIFRRWLMKTNRQEKHFCRKNPQQRSHRAPETFNARDENVYYHSICDEEPFVTSQVDGPMFPFDALPSLQALRKVSASFKHLRPVFRENSELKNLANLIEAQLNRCVIVQSADAHAEPPGKLSKTTLTDVIKTKEDKKEHSEYPNSSSCLTAIKYQDEETRFERVKPYVDNLRLLRRNDGIAVFAHEDSSNFSVPEEDMKRIENRLHNTGGRCLLLWNLEGLERKITHALVALSTNLQSFSIDVENAHFKDVPCAERQTSHCLSTRKTRSPMLWRVLVVSAKPVQRRPMSHSISLANIFLRAVEISV